MPLNRLKTFFIRMIRNDYCGGYSVMNISDEIQLNIPWIQLTEYQVFS